jgi:glyoxylase-like metal-dependent hydrolase (beta-lactamase superfamily II)
MKQIQLSNFSFEGDNNVYLFDGTETVLVDTGDWMTETRASLADQLGEYGVAFADVDRVFLTHWHGDHAGLASDIQAESGAPVYVHAADAPLVAGEEAAWQELADRQNEYFEHWEMPQTEQEILRGILGGTPLRDDPPDVTPIEDGDTFSFNDRRLDVVHAPGHAAGLCIYELENGDALTGDALLPKYTPNVGGADIRVERPLAKYLRTLDNIIAADYDRAWPGHRGVIADPTGRATVIREHHAERAWNVLDALRRLGPTDTWTISADLFGDLEHIHILHGPGETYAHLDHLERAGDVRRDGSQYRLADGVADRLDDADGRWSLAVHP